MGVGSHKQKQRVHYECQAVLAHQVCRGDRTLLTHHWRKGVSNDPTLWLRGVPQQLGMNSPEPVREAREVLFDAAIDQRWEPDFYCSDGSGSP